MGTTQITAQEIGERVLLLRRRLHLKQQELEALAGCKSGAISRLERGASVVDAVSLAGIAQALHCSADYLLGLQEEQREAREERRNARVRTRP
jgi:transcriptional regulator with XRE-family HTH domain